MNFFEPIQNERKCIFSRTESGVVNTAGRLGKDSRNHYSRYDHCKTLIRIFIPLNVMQSCAVIEIPRGVLQRFIGSKITFFDVEVVNDR
jgi:hypothetical protein